MLKRHNFSTIESAIFLQTSIGVAPVQHRRAREVAFARRRQPSLFWYRLLARVRGATAYSFAEGAKSVLTLSASHGGLGKLAEASEWRGFPSGKNTGVSAARASTRQAALQLDGRRLRGTAWASRKIAESRLR